MATSVICFMKHEAAAENPIPICKYVSAHFHQIATHTSSAGMEEAGLSVRETGVSLGFHLGALSETPRAITAYYCI